MRKQIMTSKGIVTYPKYSDYNYQIWRTTPTGRGKRLRPVTVSVRI